MKALGGSEQRITVFLLAETAAIALLASVIGYGAGFVVARSLAWQLFHSVLELRAAVPMTVVALTLLIALVATALPARRIRRFDPAVILRGE
jgi:putative ABC transport system permease protein